MGALAEKTCASCGRRITWRKKWARAWDSVRHCSAACRARRGAEDVALEDAIRELLDARARHASICPSEAARCVGGEQGWRRLLQPARDAARRLVASGEIEMTQRGARVDPSTARGPVRLRRAARAG